MKTQMTARLSFVFISLIFDAAIGQSQVPNEFQAGQPARAAEVNENFDSLDQRVQQLEVDTSTASGQVMTAIPLASEVRFLFAEYYKFRNSFPMDNGAAGAPLSTDIQNNFISSVEINANVIIATFGNNADAAIQNDTLEFVPNITGDNVYFICNPTGNVASFFSQESCVFVDNPPEPLTTIRKQVASAIPLASEARWMVIDYYEQIGLWPVDNITAGLEAAASIRSAYVESVSVSSHVVTVTYGNDADALIAGEVMLFTAVDYVGSRDWLCSAPNIPDRYTGFLVHSNGCVLPADLPPNPAVLIRQQVESGLILARNIQDLVEQFRQANGSWPQSNTEASAPDESTILNNYVTGVSIGVGGVITITYGNDAQANLNGRTVTLTPTDNIGSISWECASVTLPWRFLPYECRN